MTPTQTIRDWYTDNRHDILQCGIDGFHAAELMTALAPLFAASPWRYDVENAPKDGSEILLAWGREKLGISTFHWGSENNVWLDGSGGYIDHEYVVAFATIKQPETPNHA